MRKALLLLPLGCAISTWRPAPAVAQEFTPVTDATKSDTLVLRNGDTLTGDFRQLQRGIVTFETDAASTINVKWPRVVTAVTGKTFEVIMADGSTYIGSLKSGGKAHRILVETADRTVDVGRDSVVQMVRIKKTVWERLDGSVNAGFDYTQQQSKVDLSLAGTITYEIAHRRFGMSLGGTFSRQDGTSDIRRRDMAATYAHELSDKWFWSTGANGGSNTQLSLDYFWSIGTGPGRFLVRSDRVTVATWAGLFFRNERYEGESSRNTLPLSLTTDFQWFVWSSLNTDVSSRLTVSPILNDAGRWQIAFTAALSRDLVSSLNLSIGVTEVYDSKPPSDVNQNDFNFTSSLGWTF